MPRSAATVRSFSRMRLMTVTSTSSIVVTWACLATASAIRRAMVRRTPLNNTRSTGP